MSGALWSVGNLVVIVGCVALVVLVYVVLLPYVGSDPQHVNLVIPDRAP